MQYVAGVCNIGPKNRLRRTVIGAAFVVSSIFIYYFISSNGLDRTFILMLFPVFSMGFLNIIESIKGFCVLNGLNGTYNMDSGEKEITSFAERAKDKMRSFEIVLASVVVGAVATGIIYFV